MDRCEATYPDDSTVQCRREKDALGTLVKHEHYGRDDKGFEYTWRDVPTGGFDA